MRTQTLSKALVVLLSLCTMFLCGTAHATFGYRMAITILKAKVGASGTTANTITNYAMPINITSANLATVANSGHVQNANGYDIVFRGLDTTTCGGPASCTLSQEVISYTATTGKVVAWVRLPSVNTNHAASSTVIYVYYGDSTITTSTDRKTDVWKNYAGVWHLDETPTPATVYDSTSNARNGTTSGSPTSNASGVMGRKLNFDAINDTVSTADFLSGSSTFSVEAWATQNNDGIDQVVVGKSNTDTASSSSYVFSLGTYDPDTSPCTPSNFIRTVVDTSGGAGAQQSCTVPLTISGTSHVAFTYDGSNVQVYYNGAAQAGAGCVYAKTGTLVTTTTPVTIGSLTSPGTYLASGSIDEVRISTVTRDADYFATVYNHQSAPTSTTVRTIGAESAISGAMFGVEFLAGHAVELPNGQVLLAWETGLEQDNLGFHVLREQNGVLTQVTQDLVGGSLLRALVGGNGASPYFWLDSHGWGAGPVRYFVQDVDQSGNKATHGPFLPTAPDAATRSLLNAWSAQEASAGPTNLGKASAATNLSLSATATSTGTGSNTAPDASFVAAQSMEFAAPSGPPLIKVGVTRAGWQRVTGAELADVGFPLGVASNQVAVLKDGGDISRFIDDGADGTFDAQDTLEFWGVGEPGIYANDTVYAVSWSGPSGRNLAHSSAAPPAMSADGPTGFSTFSKYAEKKFYLAALNNGPADNFLGPVIRPSGLTLPLPTPDPLGSSELRLQVNLRGVSLLPHQVEVAWNGVTLGSVNFANRDEASFESAVADVASDNVLGLTGKAGDVDYSAIESARIFYNRAYRALNNSLQFTALGGDKVTLGGFGETGVRVVDVTRPADPLELSVLEFGAPGDVSGKVTVPGSGRRELYAFTPSAIAAPDYIKHYKSSALKTAMAADLVILSHAAFIDRLAPLVAQREREGLHVVVDDVDAIYDDFGRGRKDPEAIREAMRWLAAQGKPAKYLLLVGDGTFDPHNYLGKNVVDYLPVPTTNTAAFETAYDGYYGDLDEDGLAEVAVGRLPIKSPGDLDIAVEKLLRYAAAPPEWPLDVLLVSGEDQKIDVPQIGHLGLDGEPLSVREQALISTTPKDELLQSLAEPSSRLVTYIGHGSTQVWGNGSDFTTSDAATLSRTGPPSVFTLLTCLNGFFHDVYTESVAEGLLRAPNGAAVSVWAAPAMAESDDLGPLYHAFISEWTSGRIHTLGELVLAAKRNVNPSDTERSMALLGDPSLKLALPTIAQTRSDALAHANDPPPVQPPPVMPPPMPTVVPGLPKPKPGEHSLLAAANQRRLLQGSAPNAPAPLPVTTAAPGPSGAAVGVQTPVTDRDSGPARNHCSLTAASAHHPDQERLAGALFSLAFAGAFLSRRRFCKRG